MGVGTARVVISLAPRKTEGFEYPNFHLVFRRIIVKFVFLDEQFGVVAQMNRALDLQSRGRGFDPHLLHTQNITGCSAVG